MFDERAKGEILKKLKRARAKRLYVQVPEGLKTSAQDLVNFIESEGMTVFLSVEPCFGACDLRENEAISLKCDHMLHVGHSDFGIRTKIPVIYHSYEIRLDAIPLFKKHIVALRRFRKISLSSTVQFAHCLPAVKEYLEGEGFAVGMGKSGSMLPGQILGCNWHAATSLDGKVDCHVFLGSGKFHALGLQYHSEKPVIGIDVESGEMTNYEESKNKMKITRMLGIEKAREMKNFAIIVSVKPGQMRTGEIEKLRTKLKGMGKNVYVLVADMLNPEKLLGLNIDVIVNTACPRITEDRSLFKKTILDSEDIMGM